MQHPELCDEEEVTLHEAMAKLGARRCPSCQYIIVKDGGCPHIFCEQCHHEFDWRRAERLQSLTQFAEPDSLEVSRKQFQALVQLMEDNHDLVRHDAFARRLHDARDALHDAIMAGNGGEADYAKLEAEEDNMELPRQQVTCEMDAIVERQQDDATGV
jgi:hypothetical protein